MRLVPRRIRKRWLAAGGGLVLAAALVAPLAGQLGGWGDESAVPTVVVEPARFVRRVPADGVLEAVRATPVSLPPTVMQPMRIAWLAEDGSHVRAGDVVVRFDPTDMEKNLIDARDQLRTAELERERAVVERENELVRLGHDARLAGRELENARDFQKKDDDIFSRHEIIESEIDEELAERRMEHAEEARERRERLSDAELSLIAIDRRQADAAIGRARQGLEALELTAPHDGLLLLSRSRGETVRVGDTVFMGMPLAEIPDLSAMKASVYVLEADAGGLAVGQPAEVIVEAHPERRFAATVERVDSLAKPRLRGSPVQYFAVTLELEETVPEVMKPGARVRAWIDLGGVESALAVPRQAVIAKDGGHLVYRRTAAGGFEPVAVELGPTAMGRVVVTAGLEAGDVVALVDPTRPLAAAEDEEEGEEGDSPSAPALPGAAP
ncbi:MAG TPA: efflux RND transporter periplasmic adaptor subunit [Thermoanaerobaculia bacterium]|nr:efflux RND transporter periplasmic adaptor subunit [Thermoanaerobaculia bacterium]